jgi:hypothetical protein
MPPIVKKYGWKLRQMHRFHTLAPMNSPRFKWPIKVLSGFLRFHADIRYPAPGSNLTGVMTRGHHRTVFWFRTVRPFVARKLFGYANMAH